MSNYWNAYFGYINDKPATVALDMGVTEEVNIEDYQTVVIIKLQLKNPDERGFPSEFESKLLEKINNDIDNLINLNRYLNVGRQTSDGFREHIYYTSENDPKMLLKAADQVLRSNKYEFEVYSIDEEELWECYFEYLYPNRYQMQHIDNADILEHLNKLGDKLVLPRAVEHWIHFNDQNKMNEFINTIKTEGFIIEKRSSNLDEDFEFTLLISRIDKVDFDSIDELTDFLIEVSESFDGEYDGWETLVIKG